MDEPDRGSVSMWIDGLKAGDDEAARLIWNRYFEKLLEVARRRLGRMPRRSFDEEDVAVSVFDSLCNGAEAGRFQEMRDRTDLWKLLVTITRQKAVDRIRRETAQKRGGGGTRGESDFKHGDGDDEQMSAIDAMLREDPTPEILVAMEEQTQRMLKLLRDDSLRQVAVLKLNGYANAEVADQMSVTTRTVERKLALIRQAWKKELIAL